MARKKIVFVLVEGPSDEEALGILLNRIYDRNAVFVHIMHQDITADYRVNAANIISKIGNVIRQFAKENHYDKADFQEIIHLIDTDGAFVAEDRVVEDASAASPVYCEDRILTANREGILQRNRQKSENLDKLDSCGAIWNIPYRIFYMSCNLDHVLYDKQNSTDEEKERDSYRFAREYRENISGFLTFISESEFAVTTGYQQSWEYIKQGTHSLERHTNLGLCFEKQAAAKEPETGAGAN